MATSNSVSSDSSKKERKILISYDIPLKYPYSFPTVLNEINAAIQKKLPSYFAYDSSEHWIRIRIHVPVSPGTSLHSAMAFGWEVACITPPEVFSKRLKHIESIYYFCVQNGAFPCFSLSDDKNTLHLDIKAPNSSKKTRILEEYLSTL